MTWGWPSGASHAGKAPTRADLQAATTTFGQFALDCADPTTTIERALDLVCSILGVRSAALIRLVDERRADVVQAHRPPGARSDDVAGSPVLGPDLLLPVEVVAASENLARPLVIGDWGAQERLVGSLAARLPTVRSSVLVGVSPRDRPYAIVAVDTRPHTFRASGVEAVVAIAHLLAAAMDRFRHETAQAAVAAFGKFALESRSLQTTLRRGVDLATDVLDAAFGFVVRVVAGDRLEVLYGRGPLGEPLGGQVPLPANAVDTLASAGPILTDRSAQWRSPFAPAAPESGASSLSVGVAVEGETFRLGVTETDHRTFTDSDVDFLSSIAHLLAAAVKRDQFEARIRATSDALQRALLPADLPVLPGVESVARYLPAGQGDVGGDWYDVLPLPQGGIGLVMGDVEGHDSAAAAVMGQVRNVLRAHVAEGHPPSEVLRKVNRFVAQHIDRLASCCYLEVRPHDLTVTCVTAGHPAPVVLAPDRIPRGLPVRPGVLLGVYPEQDYEEATTVLAPGSCLLLFTDGLVGDVELTLPPYDEFGCRPDMPLDRLAAALEAAAPTASDRRDDAALLVVRLTGSTPSQAEASGAHRTFTPSTSANPAARRYVADLLSQWGLTDLCDSAVLAVSELVTNAVMHTTSSVRLVLSPIPNGVRIGVHDTNDRLPDRPRPAADLAPGGRGLGIIDEIADRWGITPTPASGGKTVWLELFRTPALRRS